MSDLLELAREACQAAIQDGAELADVALTRRRGVSINVQKNGIHDSSDRTSSGASVRSIIRGATGFYSSSELALADVLGLSLAEARLDRGLEFELVQLLVEVREKAREGGQYELADVVRDRLGQIGIMLEDRPEGTTWRVKR